MTDTANPTAGSDPRTDTPEALAALLLEPQEPLRPTAAAGPAADEDAAPPASPEPADQPEPPARRFTVRIDGKEQEVAEAELIAGYQRQADYTRKTQELAEQRRAAEAERRLSAEERAHYAQQLRQVETLLRHSLPPEPDWQQLARDDPAGYVQRRADWEAQMRRLLAVEAEGARLRQQVEAEQQAEAVRRLEGERSRLVERIPDWRDGAKAEAERRELGRYLQSEGFTEAEIRGVADSRAVVVARKAMLYDKLMAGRPQMAQRLAEAPRMVRPGAVPDRTAGAAERRQAQLAKLGRSGSIEDAAALILMG